MGKENADKVMYFDWGTNGMRLRDEKEDDGRVLTKTRTTRTMVVGIQREWHRFRNGQELHWRSRVMAQTLKSSGDPWSIEECNTNSEIIEID